MEIPRFRVPTESIPATYGARLATAQDARALAALDAQVFGAADGWSEGLYAQLLRHPNIEGTLAQRVGGGMSAEQLAGAIVMGAERGEGDLRLAHVLTVGAAPSERGQGLGAGLMATGMENALRRDPDVMYLEVEADNAAGRALHEKMGFQVVGELPGFYRDAATPGDDGLLMAQLVRDLPPDQVVPALQRASADPWFNYGM